MKTPENNPELVAACGLYCGSCRSYLKDKCKGCRENEKASWCKVRLCCIEKNIQSCADCEVESTLDCGKMNNFVSNFFSFIFKSDRHGCISCIRKNGYEKYAHHMADTQKMTIKRKQPVPDLS